jgi:hypothetical protein
MFFEEIIEIGPILSSKLGCLADIAFADFEKVDKIGLLVGISGLFQGF